MATLEIERTKTLDDLKDKLSKYGKCAVPRVAGFGKTTMAVQLAYNYKKVLYIHANSVTKKVVTALVNGEEHNVDTGYNIVRKSNIEMMSYSFLARNSSVMSGYTGYDLIVADDCHKLAGVQVSPAMHYLLHANPNAHFVGLTAMPGKVSKKDVIVEFFDRVTVYPYTLIEAFKDEIVLHPYYKYYTYDIDKSLQESALKSGISLNADELTVIKNKVLRTHTIKNMDEVIKEACDQVFEDTSYLKFIVFWTFIDDISRQGNHIDESFKKAFPDHEVKSIEIHSRGNHSDISEIDRLVRKPNTIHLIHARDMLNSGYHIKDLSGIVYMRGTTSKAVYLSQFANAFSYTGEDPKLIFDFADNIHRKSLMNALACESQYPLDELRLKLEDNLIALQKARLQDNTRTIKNLERNIAAIKKKIFDLEVKVAEEVRSNNGLVTTGGTGGSGGHGDWWDDMNNITINDLIAIGNDAVDKDIFIKAVLENRENYVVDAITSWVKAALFGRPFIDLVSSIETLKKTGYTLPKLVSLDKEYSTKSKKKSLSGIPLTPYCEIMGISFVTAIEYMKGLGCYE